MLRKASNTEQPNPGDFPPTVETCRAAGSAGQAIGGAVHLEQRLSLLKVNPRNARTHSKRQVRQLADAIRNFGFIGSIVVDENNMILAGHARSAAASLLGMETVPTLRVTGLSETQLRAFVLADNKLALNAGWDFDLLTIELSELSIELPKLDLDITLTGFDTSEIDVIQADRDAGTSADIDQIPALGQAAVSRHGDLWLLGDHRLMCGDSRSAVDMVRLMAGDQARLVFTDPPYNVPIAGHVQGRGRTKHREFAFAVGEMSRDDFTAFLQNSLQAMADVCVDGAILYVCMDWRHLFELTAAADAVGLEQKNLVVWDKKSPGQGSFYRSQHELIMVLKRGSAAHRNNFGLGAHGRVRSNVWTYAGVNSFRAGRQAELGMHPTVKPIAMVVDAIRDCSLKGDIVLDGFLGSGTTLLAAERIGRRCRGMEYDPLYVDLCIRRWQELTHQEAMLEGDGGSWHEVREARAAEHAAVAAAEASFPSLPARPAERRQLIRHPEPARQPAPRRVLLNRVHEAPEATDGAGHDGASAQPSRRKAPS